MIGGYRDLGTREAGAAPQRTAYALDSVGLAEYLDAWHLWRAIHRDASLTDDEIDARFAVVDEHLRRRIAERAAA